MNIIYISQGVLALKGSERWLFESFRSNRKGDIMRIFKQVGETFAEFHSRYGGRQHNDAGTQNVLYDEERALISDLTAAYSYIHAYIHACIHTCSYV